MCKNELKPFFRRDKIYLAEFEEMLLKEPLVNTHKIDIVQLAQIDICFSIVFYGLSSEGLLILKELFRKRHKDKFVNDILRFISLKPANDENILKKWEKVSSRNTRGKRNDLVEIIYEWRKTKKILSSIDFTDVAVGYHNRYIKYYGGLSNRQVY